LAHIAAAMIGTNDVQAALRFYDELMAVIGVGELMEHGSGGRVYGNRFGQPILTVGPPVNGKAATAGYRTMVYFMCDTKQQVEQLHAKALASGASDECAPGPRGGPESSIYAAYFRDLDGNRICASCVG
jgi:catechol 2,3-dioxygenase-like lactoylglutathione lyase family enzyme